MNYKIFRKLSAYVVKDEKSLGKNTVGVALVQKSVHSVVLFILKNKKYRGNVCVYVYWVIYTKYKE